MSMFFHKSREIWKNQGTYILPANEFIEPVIARGKGSFVWDADGNKYLDFNGGQFCLCFGHSYAPFIKAVNQQLKIIIHTNTNTLSDIVFNALQTLIGTTNKAFSAGILLSTGAEAVEFALRFSKSLRKKEKLVFINEGYHGLSLGAQSVSTFGTWAVPKVQGTFGVPVPRTPAEADSSLERMEEILKENQSDIAACIMEPILGAGGMIFPPVEFLRNIRALCDKYGILLIFDECQTGFGRTGNWFAYQTFNVVPDVLIFAKAGGAGIPVSGVLFPETLAQDMRKGTLTHFSSHQNDPLSAGVLLFVVKEIERKDILETVKKSGSIFLEHLYGIASRTSALVNPRGVGLMVAFDLAETLFTDTKNAGRELVHNLLLRGIIIQCISRGRTFRVMPNFLISSGEIAFFAEQLEEALKEVSNE